ncbi:MAG: hypothetical protein C5B48_08485 [Candidatus Rokuibacteriota bacterium]|nr:MAG: hypothetical protein C5B48_08485 [Candidatus Rokubacteria bacterium]
MLSTRAALVTVSRSAWHGAIAAFKRELIGRALEQARGNRTRAAELLGLQRTYLLRLMRELGVTAPGGNAKRGLKGLN